jgi:hypothetical protein
MWRRVVTGELGKRGAVDEPAQDEHRLPEAAHTSSTAVYVTLVDT